MRRLMTVLAAAFVLPLTACGDSGPTEPDGTVSGTYSLQTMNGLALPFMFDQPGANTVEVINGSITFNTASNTFADSITFRYTIDGIVEIDEDAVSGTYQQTGTAVILTPTFGDPYALSLSGRTLILTFGRFALVYGK